MLDARSMQVAAPGGDAYLQMSSASSNGEVLSTWPGNFRFKYNADPVICDATGGYYAYVRVCNTSSGQHEGVRL